MAQDFRSVERRLDESANRDILRDQAGETVGENPVGRDVLGQRRTGLRGHDQFRRARARGRVPAETKGELRGFLLTRFGITADELGSLFKEGIQHPGDVGPRGRRRQSP